MMYVVVSESLDMLPDAVYVGLGLRDSYPRVIFEVHARTVVDDT